MNNAEIIFGQAVEKDWYNECVRCRFRWKSHAPMGNCPRCKKSDQVITSDRPIKN